MGENYNSKISPKVNLILALKLVSIRVGMNIEMGPNTELFGF